ncbi:hypothetical protein BDF19DRAFT_384173 [Syncephalis fuscata]|nr:hypothetical protein BDF19DRAFT_384173 [Syncephalis fuscata]
MALGLDIKGKARETSDDVSFVGPTPNNTPVQAAPIASRVVSEKPTVGGIVEEGEDDDAVEINMGGAPSLTGLGGDLFAGNQRLVSMLQGRLGSLLGKPSGYIESLPTPVRRRVNGLKYLQSQHTELEIQFHKEILELEKKFLTLYRPLYEKRAEIIQGKLEPTDEEVAAGVSDNEEDEEKDEEKPAVADKEEEGDANTTGIPEFWLTGFKNHAGLCEMITDMDEEPLKALRDVKIEYTEEKPGFNLIFEFDENDYFTNRSLTKTYYYQQSANFGDLVYESSRGCDIEWKEGKDLTVVIETKKQRHKTTNKTRVVRRAIPNETFFSFFETIQTPEEDEVLEDEEQDELDSRLEADYELGEEFKEKIIPHAVDWFTGKALQYESMDMEEEYDDENLFYAGSTDDDEEDEEDDDDDDDEDY